MARNTGTGQGGKTLNDRKLAAEVRTLGLRQIKAILEGKNPGKSAIYSEDLHRQVLLKLAPGLLPKLNEHTGEDGVPLNLIFDNAFARRPEEDRK